LLTSCILFFFAFSQPKPKPKLKMMIWENLKHGPLRINYLLILWLCLEQFSNDCPNLGHTMTHVNNLCHMTGLCTKRTQVPQATNFCFWTTGKTYFFHISLSARQPGFHGLAIFGLLVIFLRPQPWIIIMSYTL